MSLMVSGTRKSPVQTECIAPLIEAERMMQEATQLDRAQAYADMEVLKKKKDRAINEKAKAKDHDAEEKAGRTLGNVLDSLRNALMPPPPPRLLIEDITAEKLVMHLEEHGGLAGLFSDEGGIFQTMLGRYGGMSNLDAFLKAHDGRTPIHVDRIGRGSLFVERPLMVIGLTVQPIVLEGLVRNHPELRGQGLLPRFLAIMPDTYSPGMQGRIGYREITPKVTSEATREAYCTLIKQHAAEQIPEEPTRLHLSETARETFEAWRWRFEDAKRGRGAARHDLGMGNEAGRAGAAAGPEPPPSRARVQARGQLARGRGVDQVSDETMRAAISICEFAIPHAIAVDDLTGGQDAGLDGARVLLSWLARQGIPAVHGPRFADEGAPAQDGRGNRACVPCPLRPGVAAAGRA